MPIMDVEVFKGYADRIAGQFRILKTSILSMSAGTPFFEQLTVTADPDVEIPMLGPARNQDVAVTIDDAAVKTVKGMSGLTGLITAFESHLLTQTEDSDISSWDTYCTDQDVRVSEYTDKVFLARHGRHMLARNVFCESEIIMAECTVGPSGIIISEDALSLGTGSVSQKAESGFAGAQLAAILNTEIVSGLDIEIVGLSETGLTRRLSTDSGLIVGPSGSRIDIPPPSGRFVSISEVNLLSGGSEGDSFDLVNIIERDTEIGG